MEWLADCRPSGEFPPDRELAPKVSCDACLDRFGNCAAPGWLPHARLLARDDAPDDGHTGRPQLPAGARQCGPVRACPATLPSLAVVNQGTVTVADQKGTTAGKLFAHLGLCSASGRRVPDPGTPFRSQCLTQSDRELVAGAGDRHEQVATCPGGISAAGSQRHRRATTTSAGNSSPITFWPRGNGWTG